MLSYLEMSDFSNTCLSRIIESVKLDINWSKVTYPDLIDTTGFYRGWPERAQTVTDIVLN